MTSRERILRLASGAADGPKPVLRWPGGDGGDFAFTSSDAPMTDDGRLRLAEVCNPFGRSLRRGENPNDVLSDDPDRGSRLMEALVGETRREIDTAMAGGADGILYVLFGAGPAWSTPMQYGGFHLERDRELLEAASSASFNLVFVVGSPEAYLDFVSDLPAAAFGWDCRRSGFDLAAVRSLRPGLLCAEDARADIVLEPKATGELAEALLIQEAIRA